jgi:hypothetical protein
MNVMIGTIMKKIKTVYSYKVKDIFLKEVINKYIYQQEI